MTMADEGECECPSDKPSDPDCGVEVAHAAGAEVKQLKG
jgi:hypothetical protein